MLTEARIRLPGAAEDTVFHYRPGDIPFENNIKRLARADYRLGAPPGLLELEDAFILPGVAHVFDRHGVPVDLSVVRRAGVPVSTVEQRTPDRFDFTVIEEPAFFAAPFIDHWGHALTESISRFWALPEIERRIGRPPRLAASGKPYVIADMHPNILAFFAAGGIDIGRYLPRDTRLQFRRLFVPEASFENQMGAYQAHIDLPRRAALRVLETQTARPERTRKVYFSRARLTGEIRYIKREDELEAQLVRRGVEIVHAETLGFTDQVKLWAEIRVAIGCIGSALHGVAFALDPGVEMHLLCAEPPNANFPLFDAMTGARSHYVKAMTRARDAEKIRLAERVIDVDLALAYLGQAGVLG